MTIPLIKTFEMLLTSDYLSDPLLLPELHLLHSLTSQEITGSKNISKLMSAAGLFSGLLAY